MFASADEDLIKFIEAFYTEIRQDELLGPIFNEMITNWDKHIRKIAVFWKSHLKEPGLYKGNPLEIHRRLHSKSPFTEEQFVRWLGLFEQVAKDYFVGDDLKSIKQKSCMIGGTLYGRLLDKDLEVPGFNPFN